MCLSEAISSGRSKSAPVFFGMNACLFMPSPQNQVPKRVGSGDFVDANAVPFSLRKQSSTGSPTATAPPLSMPRNRRLRLIGRVLTSMGFLHGDQRRRGLETVEGPAHGNCI